MIPDVLETAKFLKQLEEQALKNITATVRQGDNSIHFGGVAVNKNSNLRNTIEWRFSIYLNEQETLLTDEVELKNAYDPHEIKQIISKSIVDKLMSYILPHVLPVITKI